MNSRNVPVAKFIRWLPGTHPGALPRTVVGQVDERFAEHTVIVFIRFKAADVRGDAPVPAFIRDIGRAGHDFVFRLNRIVDEILMLLKAHVAADHVLNDG